MTLLLIDQEDNVLVNLPKGKIKNTGYRTSMNKQKGATCILSSMRRLTMFTPGYKETKLYQAMKAIKHELENYQDDTHALNTAIGIFEDLDIPYQEVIENHSAFIQFKNKMPYTSEETLWKYYPDRNKFFNLYNFIRKEAYGYLNIAESSWSPAQGPEALLETVRTHGALMVVGKYGISYREGGSESLIPMPHLNTENRIVFGFNPNSYQDNYSNWLHAVIIDQVKKIDDQYLVFFRDPNWDSKQNSDEPVFMLPYDSFIEHITCIDTGIFYKDSDVYSSDNVYALCSTQPFQLTKAPIIEDNLFNGLVHLASTISSTINRYFSRNDDAGITYNLSFG